MPALNRPRVYVFPGMGAVSLASSGELPATPLGRALRGFMALFRRGRGMAQLALLRIDDWRMHRLSAPFVLGAALQAVPLWLLR